MFDKFFDLVIRLEPENLHRNGESTQSESTQRANQIQKEWNELEVEQGRAVSQGDIFSEYWQRRRSRTWRRNNA